MIDEKKLISELEKWLNDTAYLKEKYSGSVQIKDSEGDNFIYTHAEIAHDAISTVIEKINEQEKISEWIPYTEENKPKKEGFYLITVKTIFLGEPELLVKKEWFSEKNGCFNGYSNAVVAWVPMPEPYKEG